MDLPLALSVLFLILVACVIPTAVLLFVFHPLCRNHRPAPPPVPAAALGPRAPAAEEEDEAAEEKRPRRRARRKQQQQQQQQQKGGDAAAAAGDDEALLPRRPQFPLASVAGALQRRINARYDDLARASQAHSLTTDQVSAIVRACAQCNANILLGILLADLARSSTALMCRAQDPCSDDRRCCARNSFAAARNCENW
jgi:hypothetical protein